jgi:hypothetical protein
MPFVDEVNRDPVGGVRWLKIVTTIALNGDDIIAAQVAGEGDIADLFLAAAQRVDALSQEAIELRAPIAMFSMLSVLATANLGGYGRPIGRAGLDPEFVDQLALFTSSGLQAG